MKLLPLLLLGSAVWATTFLQRPFPETVADAPVIVRGRIGSASSDWGTTAEGQKRIYTMYDLALSEVLKGPVNPDSKTLVVRELGGTKNGIGMQISGTAQFDTGEDVVVLLNNRNPDGSYDVRGMMMGKLNVKQDSNGADTLAGPALAEPKGDGLVHDDTSNQQQGGSGAANAWTLDRLRHLIDEQKAGAPVTDSFRKPKASPAATPLASPRQSARAASPSPAPGLQPSDGEDAGSGSSVWSRFGVPFIVVALLIGAALTFLIRRRK
jgi:hypothetical protein